MATEHFRCLSEVRTLKARYTLATVKLALSKYRERDPRRSSPITRSCAQEGSGTESDRLLNAEVRLRV
jgi:hypothetical protein